MNIKEIIEEKIKGKKKKQKSKMIVKVIGGTVAGLTTGVVSGVLGAPKSGKETRENIAGITKGIGENAINKTIAIKKKLGNKFTKINASTSKRIINKCLSDKKEEQNWSYRSTFRVVIKIYVYKFS